MMIKGTLVWVDVDLAGLSRTIDPTELGRRIRAARVAAGLTQSELADGTVTAAYVSRIERGQRRPAAPLLEALASRMGTTGHQLLTGFSTHEARSLELQIEHAAITITLGDAEQALQMADAVLGVVVTYRDDALHATALRVRAEALLAIGRLEEAIEVLEKIVAGPNPDMNTLRALITLCRCYGTRGEPGRAIAIGEVAQRQMAELGVDGLAETLRLAAAVAEAHLLCGSLGTAERVCREALRSYDTAPSELDRASSYWRASTAEAAVGGATPAAVQLASMALALAEIGDGNQRVGKLLASATPDTHPQH